MVPVLVNAPPYPVNESRSAALEKISWRSESGGSNGSAHRLATADEFWKISYALTDPDLNVWVSNAVSVAKRRVGRALRFLWKAPVVEIAQGDSIWFSRSGGWQRSSVLGREQADVDLVLTQPTIGETAWVQVKSRTSQAELDDYLDRFRRDGSCDRFFFICHSAAGALGLPTEPGLHLWTGDRLSDAAIDAGLFGWLIDRTR